MKKRILSIMFTALLFLSAANIFGQGSTTSGINGTVTDASNQAIPGATVVVLHVPSGTQYGAITSDKGTFQLSYMRSGGPYKISVEFLGYKTQIIENVTLALGEDRNLDFTMETADQNLGEVIVTARTDKTFNSGRTGAASNISNEQISTIPSLNRSLSDMTRLTPQSSGLNFAGRNSLYNNLSIDGSVFNNSFGLASTPGGQTNSQPISLDAIEEIQVSLAPYDVRQSGFTGAGINAITRSGTNEIKGSVYYFFRNQDYVSKKVGGQDVTNNNFNNKQMGFRLGGPIIKNKLFFFINAEMERRDDPGTTFLAGRPGLTGNNVSSVQAADLDALKSFLMTNYSYDPGVYENYKMNTTSDKFLARLDYNLGKKHKISLRYNYLKSYKDNLPSSFSSGTNSMIFSNSLYGIYNNINSVIGEVNSNISDKISNNFIVGWTGFNDYRESPSSVFPMLEIQNNGATMTALGYEQFSAKNTLKTSVFQVSDNLTYRMGNHAFTAGISYEGFKFENSFIRQYYGFYRYSSMANFYNSANAVAGTQTAAYQYQQSAIAGNPEPLAKLNSAQLGLYVQDEWKIVKGLKLTYGLRVDMPFYPSELDKNSELDGMTFSDAQGANETIDVSVLPKAKPLFAPRLGFNYDVFGNRITQIRGGAGIFTGRIPFVWISNQASNNGVMWNRIDATNSTIYPFKPDVNAYQSNLVAVPSYEINSTTTSFKFPQVLRYNFAVDQKIPGGMVLTVEGIYTKDLNAVYHRNSNLPINLATELGQDGRLVYPANTTVGTSTVYGNRANQKVSASYILDNTSKGSSYFLTAQLQKSFESGFDLMASYTYSQTKDMSSNPGSTASSAFRFNPAAINPNDPALTYSLFDQPHKLVASVNYSIEFLKHAKTSVSLIYVGSQSGRYSYVYAGDINRDGFTDNDLIYVPNDATDISLRTQATSGTMVDTRTVAEIWGQLNAYITQDPYLNSNRGKIIPRNGGVSPWTNQIDVRFAQEMFLNVAGKKQSFEFTLDVINIGNLMNSDWGVKKFVNKTNFLQFRGFNATTGVPEYSFPYADFANKIPYTSTFLNNSGLSSRWQIQIGLRYTFN